MGLFVRNIWYSLVCDNKKKKLKKTKRLRKKWLTVNYFYTFMKYYVTIEENDLELSLWIRRFSSDILLIRKKSYQIA